MTTEAAWQPQMVPGGGRDRRIERRKTEMRELWAEAWEAADRGHSELADELFMEANGLGMALPTEERRICRVTGTIALGHARLPYTDWDADVAVSHGDAEPRPTALHRYVGGWTDGNGVERKPEPILGTTYTNRAKEVVGIARQGLDPLFALLGLDRPGAVFRVDYDRDGTVRLHPHTPAGPRALED